MSKKERPYARVIELVERLGGTMTWYGRAWHINMPDGKTAKIPVLDNSINALDRLYVAKGPNPQIHDPGIDYEIGAPLAENAEWQLFQLLGEHKAD